MKVASQQINVKNLYSGRSPLANLQEVVENTLGTDTIPLRLSVTGRSRNEHHCEVEAVFPRICGPSGEDTSIFDYRPRRIGRTDKFNAVMLIPTGVDCAIGGHAGDATPAARLLASVCDHLVLHPNVVNASDVNEQTENSLYAEGSLICRLMMGTVGLKKVRQNRVLLVTENRTDAPNVVDQTINCAEGARATLGMDISEVLVLDKELFMQTGVSDSGRVTGRIERLEKLIDLLIDKRGTYDAVALATRITPHIDTVELHRSYFGEGGPESVGRRRGDAHAPALDGARRAVGPRPDDEQRSAAHRVVGRCRAAEGRRGHLDDLPVLRAQGPQPGAASRRASDGQLRPVGDDGRRRLVPGDSGRLRWLADPGGRRAGHPRDRGAWQHEPDAERPAGHCRSSRASSTTRQNYYEAAGIMAGMKAGVAPATLARPMQPLRINRVGAEAEVVSPMPMAAPTAMDTPRMAMATSTATATARHGR